MKRVHLIIIGRVQGVCFRLHTKQVANIYNVKGFVRNLPNGNVEVVAEGSKNNIAKLIAFCRKGVGITEVTNILIEFKSQRVSLINFL